MNESPELEQITMDAATHERYNQQYSGLRREYQATLRVIEHLLKGGILAGQGGLRDAAARRRWCMTHCKLLNNKLHRYEPASKSWEEVESLRTPLTSFKIFEGTQAEAEAATLPVTFG